MSSPQTPIQRATDAPKLAPSPEIASSSSSGTSSGLRHCDPTSSSPRSNDPVLIPREMPAFSDRQSIHWPGFDVHPDTYIAIPTSQTTDPIPDALDNHDEDDTKENIKPRRRSGKKLTLDEGNPGKPVRLCRAEKYAQESGDVHVMPMLSSSPEKKALDPRARQQERKHNMLIMVRELDEESNEEEDVEQQL